MMDRRAGGGGGCVKKVDEAVKRTSATRSSAVTGRRGCLVSFDWMRFTTNCDLVRMFTAVLASCGLIRHEIDTRLGEMEEGAGGVNNRGVSRVGC